MPANVNLSLYKVVLLSIGGFIILNIKNSIIRALNKAVLYKYEITKHKYQLLIDCIKWLSYKVYTLQLLRHDIFNIRFKISNRQIELFIGMYKQF